MYKKPGIPGLFYVGRFRKDGSVSPRPEMD
jgi:hypothetical protein